MSQQDMDRPRVAYDADGDPWFELVHTGGMFQQGGTSGDGDQLTLAQISEQYGLWRVVVQEEQDLLLWLHAEAVWERDLISGPFVRLGIKHNAATRELRDLRVEMTRLRREVEFEANGASTFAGADAIADGTAFVAEDFGLDVDTEAGGVYVSLNHRRAARTEAWGDDVNVDYDADGIPTGVEILRRPSLPLCAVHPEADR